MTSGTDGEPSRYTYEEAAELDESDFDGGTIGRRTFLSVAAATGAALTLPGAVSAEVSDDAVTDVAEFAVNATPEEYEATLVLEFEDSGALGAFYDEYGEPGWDIDEDDLPPKVETREEPTPAAHAYLTEDQLADALDMGGIEFVDFSPGANPFWKLDGSYQDGVFPSSEDARDFVSHEEAGQAFEHLDSEYPNRVRSHVIGHGPGYENQHTGDLDQRDLYVVEITENLRDEESFQEKDKAVFIVGIHGDEPAGREEAPRIIEQFAKGEADDFADALEDVVISYVFVNPDGWFVREPMYEYEGWSGLERFRFRRGNSSGLDSNRQYPTIGWANPSFWPAEPEEAPDPRPGEDVGYEDMVPDSLATVEFLREYDNVEYVCDYHMMDTSASMVLNLESNAPYDHNGTHNLDEVNRRIRGGMNDHWGSPDAIADDTSRMYEGYVPDRFMDYGSIYDSLGYNITGGLLGWGGQPEEFGGLGAVTVAPELVLRDGYDYKPYIERHLHTAYRISMREFADMTAASTNSTVVTGENDTAYVTTDELTRSSADLSHTDESPGQGNGKGQQRATEVQRRHGTVQPGPGGSASAAAGSRTHSLGARFDASGVDEGVVSLVNPGGQVVRAINLAESDESSFYVPNPADGDWSIRFDGDGEFEAEFTTIETDEEHPDPEEAFGYSQTEYVVNPMQFFEDLEPFLEDGDMEGLRVHDVRVGRLMRGNSGERRYDKLVISHDVGRDDDRYISEIEEFVEAGGDLLLTDTGLYLLAELEIGEAANVSEEDLETTEVRIANLRNRNFDHYLLEDIRELQHEIWKSPQVGYSANEEDQPVTIIDEDAFEATGGEMAGTLGGFEGWVYDPEDGWEYIEERGEVGAGSFSAGDSEINFIGTALPPANQRELHPFGMADYAVTFMGHTLICNALGFEQHRYVNGELIDVWGELR